MESSEKKNNSEEIKRSYFSRRDAIVKQHRRGAGGIRVARALSSVTDLIIEDIFSSLPAEHQDLLAVVATGGYGRNELCFASDIDILFLVSDDRSKKAVAGSVKIFLHQLLTLEVSVGHSFRTINECIAIAKRELEPSMSLLEARYVCGNALLFGRFQREMRGYIEKRNDVAFVRRLLQTTGERYRKYGSSSQLLEPNIKNSAGGLRDLHTVLWLLYGSGFYPLPSARNMNAVQEFLSFPFALHLFTKQTISNVLKSYDFLLRLRNEMHLQAESLQDSLEFSLQRKVALGLGFRDRGTMTAVEYAMQRYHRSVQEIERFTKHLFAWARTEWGLENRTRRITVLDHDFYIRSSTLSLQHSRLRFSPSLVLRTFLYQCQHQATLSFELEDALHRASLTLKPSFSSEELQLFRTLFNQPHGVAEALRSMSELGILERWIPEWKKMRSFYQHNQYHIYTADEHTLRVLSFAEKAMKEEGICGHVCRQLPRKDVLMLSCLFHDIGKPTNLQKHETEGKKIVSRILKRLKYDDVLDDVMFLVRHHLLMEQIAFRRNLDDFQTIATFAKHCGDQTRLRYLFVLTLADLSAVNPTVLTTWKRTLLETLYMKTEKFFAAQHSVEKQPQVQQERYRDLLAAFSSKGISDELENHLKLLNADEYLQAFSEDEIERHLSLLRSQDTISTFVTQAEHRTEITIIADDAPFLLSNLCGVLTAHTMNILEAQIFTRSDGKVIDRFRIVDLHTQLPVSNERIEQISSDFKMVLQNMFSIDGLMKQNEQRWKRHRKPLNPTTKCEVVFSDHPQYTIIDVYGEDTFGLLYRIARVLSEEGCDIRFAKISTRLDGIVDSFYVLDRMGGKITNPKKLEHIRNGLLSIVRKAEKEG